MPDKTQKNDQVQDVISQIEASPKPHDFRQASGITTEESEHARQTKNTPVVSPDWNTVRQAVGKVTEPTPINPNTTPTDSSWDANKSAAWNAMANAASVGGNVIKRAGRVAFGTIDVFPQTTDIVHRLFSPNIDTSQQAESELLSLHPGAQIADRVKEAIDEWRSSKSLAAENVLGDLIGYWVMGRSGREITPEMRLSLEKDGVVLPPEAKTAKPLSKPEPQTIEGETGKPDKQSGKPDKLPAEVKAAAATQIKGLLDDFRGQSSENKIYHTPAATPEEIKNNATELDAVKKQIRDSAPRPLKTGPTPEWEQKAEAWLEQNQPLVRKLRDLDKDRYRLNNQDVGEIRQLTDGRKVIFMSREGLRTMANANSGTYEPDYGMMGVTIGSKGVDPTLRILRRSESPLSESVAGILMRGRNADGSITISYRPEKNEKLSDVISVLREELSHAWQHGLTKDGEEGVRDMFRKGTWDTLNAIIPHGMKAYLHENGYDLDDPGEAVTEASAKLLGFRPSEFNMSTSEASNFLFQYFQEVEKKYGAKAFDNLVHINQLGRQLKGYFSGKQQPAADTGRQPSQGTVGSLQTGGTGRDPQSPSQAGNGLGPTTDERARLDQLRNLRYQAHDKSDPFFLKTESILADKMRGPMPANSILGMLNGKVKPDELKWTGLQEFLTAKGNTPVSPAEIKDFLAKNDISIKENIKGGGSVLDLMLDKASKTVYHDWQLSGGKDYREMTFQINPDQPNQVGDKHWLEKNVIGHIRWNTRRDTSGRRLLHIEELQSDWHQKGRQKGYMSSEVVAERDAALRNYSDLENQAAAVLEKFSKYTSGRSFSVARVSELPKEAQDLRAQYGELSQQLAAAKFHLDRLDKQVKETPPEAPFKKSWPELLFKRMLRYAADNGYDGVSWTPGEEQAARYNLSKWVRNIDYIKAKDSAKVHIAVFGLDGGEIHRLGGWKSPQEVESMLGKDIAKKIEAEPNDGAGRSLQGENLKVGGEGMKGFYDQIVPSVVNDVGKQWGVKVGETEIRSEDKTHKVSYLPVTPEMRQSISAGKQSLFNKIGPAEMRRLEALRQSRSAVQGATR